MTNHKTGIATTLLILVAILSALTVAGCSEEKSSGPGTGDYWLDHYNEAWKLYQAGEYAKMVTVMEATKDQAKMKAGANSAEWGDYLTRLARAHYYAGDSAGAAAYGAEAVPVLEGAKCGASNKYRANWFAGVGYADQRNYAAAKPYLEKALLWSGQTDANWNLKDGAKVLYDRLESCYQVDNDTANVAKIKKLRQAKLK